MFTGFTQTPGTINRILLNIGSVRLFHCQMKWSCNNNNNNQKASLHDIYGYYDVLSKCIKRHIKVE